MVNNGVPVSSLVGTGNVDRLLSEIDKLYSRIVAQVLNANRNQSLQTTNAKSTSSPLTVSGSLHIPDRIRLTQTPVSTRILEVLLLIMTTCAIDVYLVAADSTSTNGILPQNPHCIAAVASLLANSSIVQKGREDVERGVVAVQKQPLIPPGSECCSDKELARRGIFEGYSFSMGYWRDGGNEGSVGAGVHNAKAKGWFGIDVGVASRV
ncbi:uncharacterized protein K452DRAFT_361722 [Aplosporella prunicola CBS 121167]|uniref:Uncharacterized protein n=1 Tax=Aplosporella prunicola CBS 121167 TaxID=1176127 RepID=A0A6A6B2G4_9PEZI|nr:uncharacterized protein K452DRAFT_361722 [Aplosporella prunicola CBS 121167]KAF2137778.1 hypothetical protein K452DRAFT_361722 [Aplosporella prunicola CBS 121167]